MIELAAQRDPWSDRAKGISNGFGGYDSAHNVLVASATALSTSRFRAADMGKKDGWLDLLEAARRKFEIARDALNELMRILPPKRSMDPAQAPDQPPVAVQRNFESIIGSAVAAIDQVAQATNSALRLRAKPQELFDKAFGELSRSVPALGKWRDRRLGVDLRRIRVKAFHYHYGKRFSGMWEVQDTGAGYLGNRELPEYSQAVVRYIEKLVSFLPQIEMALRAHIEAVNLP